ncbi:MAG: hypothetical protein A2275_07865 [Bacteroidetes bacterium RIFOXYA12_FULL_35_11]|nr:MAG: hypothetical protein A2X01_06690 [Bacteroidetes bacterium GWF2_35_48]OFY78904.1 MAG: hypothetical protein A2275_07865 [Bacteroidetes bacterium RIFOXYA12_FULL_35_11]HBX49660.1 hypothetical protein [Bacteroidales bacterium]
MKKIILLLFSVFALTQINAQSWQTLYFDDFNRADGTLGSNYTVSPSPGMTQSNIFNNEFIIANEAVAPAYCMASYVNAINYDSIRISCKFRAPYSGYGFSIGARDNGQFVYRAGIMSNSDTIGIYLYDYTGGSTTLAAEKAYLDISKTYVMDFSLKSNAISFKFVEFGTTDTIALFATANTVAGNNINFGSYHFTPNVSIFIDDFKIEAYTSLTSIDDLIKDRSLIYPNPAFNTETITIDYNFNNAVTLNIYNILGKLVRTEILQKDQNIFNLDYLYNGIYIVEIKSKEWSAKQKLIVKK